MKPASDWTRLCACLMISCLLHATLCFMPYLGGSPVAPRSAPQGGQIPKPSRTLNATLALERKSAFAPAETSPAFAGAGSTAGPSAEDTAAQEPRAASNRSKGIGLLPIPAPTYYTTDQLTQRPQPTAEAQLDTPEIWPIPASGTIILKLWISEFGEVVSADVEKTDLPEIFSRTAVAAFRSLPFVPGEINGRRVGTIMRIEVIYDDSRRLPP